MTEVSPRSSRPLNAAWLGGVCAGLSDHLGWSPLVLRVLFVVLATTRLVGVGLYLVLWLVMPRGTTQRAAPGIEAATRTGMRMESAGGGFGTEADADAPRLLPRCGRVRISSSTGEG